MLRILFSVLIVASLGSVGVNTYFDAQQPEPVKERPRNEKIIMGFLSNLSTSTNIRSIEIDDAEWLLGEDAIDVAIADNYCDKRYRASCLINNYYIRNVNHLTKTYQISSDVEVFMQTYQPGDSMGVYLDYKVTLETFTELLLNPEKDFRKSPYNVLLIDNVIVKITEIYLP